MPGAEDESSPKRGGHLRQPPRLSRATPRHSRLPLIDPVRAASRSILQNRGAHQTLMLRPLGHGVLLPLNPVGGHVAPIISASKSEEVTPSKKKGIRRRG